MLGELEHILLSLGEKLEREEVDILIKECCDPEDDDGFIPYEPFLRRVVLGLPQRCMRIGKYYRAIYQLSSSTPTTICHSRTYIIISPSPELFKHIKKQATTTKLKRAEVAFCNLHKLFCYSRFSTHFTIEYVSLS